MKVELKGPKTHKDPLPKLSISIRNRKQLYSSVQRSFLGTICPLPSCYDLFSGTASTQ